MGKDMVKSIYNFVPLNQYVYIPEWSDKVSMDVPFEEGESGVIKVRLRNTSPLIVADGLTNSKKDKKKEPVSPSCIDVDGRKQYFIPATSLKGMIRSVAEILSFSKMSRYDNDSFGERPIGDRKRSSAYVNSMQNYRCGFLTHTNNGYEISECEYERIKISEIERFENKGAIVRTGPIKGKKHEHIFLNETGLTYTLTETFVKQYLSIYKQSSNVQTNMDHETIVKKLRSGERVPVFFHTQGETVRSFGFARMYRVPFRKDVASCIRQKYCSLKGEEKVGYDMTDTLFGYVEGSTALRGRVQVGHAFCTDAVTSDLVTASGVLGKPKASFYPFYLKQDRQSGQYSTYSDNNAEIAGRKRYRVLQDGKVESLPQGNGNEKTLSQLRALPAGCIFEFRISVHNLLPAEIGMLLSAITLHNNPSSHHSIGLAKGHGYGKLSVESVVLEGFKKESKEGYIGDFESLMDQFTQKTVGKPWADTPQVMQLLAIASDHTQDGNYGVMSLGDYTTMKSSPDHINSLPLSEPSVNVKSFESEVEKVRALIRSNSLQQARKRCLDLFEMFPKESGKKSGKTKDLLDEISEKERVIAEKKRIEELKQEEEAERTRQEKLREQQEIEQREALDREVKKADKRKRGFAVLDDKKDTGEYLFSRWDGNRLTKMMKAFGWEVVPEDQIRYLIDYIKRLDIQKEKDKKSIKEFLNKKIPLSAEIIIKETNI